MHFAAAVAAFETQLQANQRSRHTVSSYLRDLGMLRSWIERAQQPLEVEAITPSLLLQFAVSPACTHQEDGRPRLPSSVDKIKMSVRSFFAFLHDAALLPTNPARVLKYRRGRERVRETLTDDECRRLLDVPTGAHGGRDATILALFLEMGIRLDALACLDVDDARPEEGRIVLRHMKGGNETSKTIPRKLVKRLKDYLRWRMELDTDCPAMFISSWKRRLSTRQIQQMVARRGLEAGIAKHVTPHVLRRTFGTRMYAETRDLLRVQRALDHRSVMTTMRYAAVLS